MNKLPNARKKVRKGEGEPGNEANELQSFIEKNDTEMRKAIRTDMRVALTLWLLAIRVDYCTIGQLFGVSKSTVCLVSKEVWYHSLL